MEFSPIDLRQLRDLIREHFSEDELRYLCISLGIEFDNLGGFSIGAKSWELVLYMRRHGRLDELVDLCRQVRPSLDWPRKPAPSVAEPSTPGTLGQFIIIGGFVGAKRASIGYNEGAKIGRRVIHRLDAALPAQVQRYVSFELAVAIRRPGSPVLQEDDLDKTKSGNLQVEWPEEAGSIALRVQVSAPECQIHGDDSWSFRLKKRQDSPVHYFQLTPKQTGRIGMVITVYQEQEWLGGTRLHTMAQEQVAGKVAVQVYSRPIDNFHNVQVGMALTVRTLFSPAELRQLCFTLKVPYDDLPGETHTELARELVTYMVRHGRFIDLIQQCQQERPHEDWEELAGIVTAGGETG